MPCFENIGCWKPTKERCYLPYNDRKYYWKEAKKFAALARPDLNWEKSESTFRKVWKESRWNKVLLIKRHKPVSDCKECKSYIKKIMQSSKMATLRFWQEKRAKHYSQVRLERDAYTKARDDATREPRKYLCLIIDGMDQKKTDIPNARGYRNRSDDPVIKTRIIGVKVHGRRQVFYVTPPGIHTIR